MRSLYTSVTTTASAVPARTIGCCARTLIRWTDTNEWVDRDGMPPPETMIVIAVDEALQEWQGKKPVEVIRDKPLPDVNTLNEATDKNTWEIGLDNKPKPPWVHSYLVYSARSGDGDDLHLRQQHPRRKTGLRHPA